jgi:2-(1,2-epoxy-1,2-dihydrophenyl)acetyl-CoA isomerase
MNEPRHVLVSTDGPVGTLTLNRPEKMNALIGTMRDELAAGLERFAADEGIRAVIISGAGPAFCTGADVRYLDRLLQEDRLDEFRNLVQAGRRVVSAIVTAPKPVIAAINGPAAGAGANLALACDLRWASDHASIGQTFSNLGLHPDWGGAYFVPRLVGEARAAELFFLGEMVDARTALELGLVNRVVPHDGLLEEVSTLARRLCARPALALRLAKQAVRRSLGAGMDEMLEYEAEAQAACFRTADAREGARAFLEKRRPVFGRDAPTYTGRAAGTLGTATDREPARSGESER